MSNATADTVTVALRCGHSETLHVASSAHEFNDYYCSTCETFGPRAAAHRCDYCATSWEGSRWEHDCRTSDLPRATRRDGKYAMRLHEHDGYVMWVDVPDRKKNGELAGTSYVVGHVMDPSNFAYAVYEAQVEERALMAEARAEFGG